MRFSAEKKDDDLDTFQQIAKLHLLSSAFCSLARMQHYYLEKEGLKPCVYVAASQTVVFPPYDSLVQTKAGGNNSTSSYSARNRLKLDCIRFIDFCFLLCNRSSLLLNVCSLSADAGRQTGRTRRATSCPSNIYCVIRIAQCLGSGWQGICTHWQTD